MKKNNKGFTLVELIVVIAVIAVLSAVAIPQYIKYVERSRQGMDASTLQEIKHIVEIEAATTENLNAASTFTIAYNPTPANAADPKVTYTGTNDLASGTAAYTNITTTCAGLEFKSSKSAGSYKLVVDGGAIVWDTASGNAIAALQKGTK